MTTLNALEGRVTIVLTPELRELALARLGAADYADDGEALVAWFDPTETPDNHVLDAAYSEAEGLMVSVIVDAINGLHTQNATRELDDVDPDQDWDRDHEIRILTR